MLYKLIIVQLYHCLMATNSLCFMLWSFLVSGASQTFLAVQFLCFVSVFLFNDVVCKFIDKN